MLIPDPVLPLVGRPRDQLLAGGLARRTGGAGSEAVSSP